MAELSNREIAKIAVAVSLLGAAHGEEQLKETVNQVGQMGNTFEDDRWDKHISKIIGQVSGALDRYEGVVSNEGGTLNPPE